MCFLLTQMTASFIVIIAMVNSTHVMETESAISHVYWSLMPIVGALMASSMAFLLNRVSEDRRAVAGRVIGALVSGVTIPRLLTYFHPWIKTMTMDPIILLMFSFLCGLTGYAAAKYIVAKAFKEAPNIVDNYADRFADSVSSKVVDKINAPATKPEDQP